MAYTTEYKVPYGVSYGTVHGANHGVFRSQLVLWSMPWGVPSSTLLAILRQHRSFGTYHGRSGYFTLARHVIYPTEYLRDNGSYAEFHCPPHSVNHGVSHVELFPRGMQHHVQRCIPWQSLPCYPGKRNGTWNVPWDNPMRR